MSTSKILLKGSAIRTLALILNIVIGFLLLPFLVTSLGDESYGIWVLVNVYIGFYGLMDLGIATTCKRFIVRASQENEKKFNEAFSTSVITFSFLSITAIIITVMIIIFAKNIVSTDVDIPQFQLLIGLLGLKVALNYPVFSFYGLIQTKYRFDIISYINIFTLILRSSLVVVFILKGYGVVVLASATLVAEIIGYVLTAYIANKMFKNVRFSRKHVNIKLLKEYYNYGKFTFVIMIAEKVRFSIDAIIISAFIGIAAVTHYNIALTLITYFARLQGSVFDVFEPSFTIYSKNGEDEKFREKFLITIELSALMSVYLGGLLIILGSEFIDIWMGENYSDAYIPLLILSSSAIISNTQRSCISVLYATSKHKSYAIISIIEAIANLSLSIYLVTKYGMIGAALGTAIPSFLVNLIFLPIYTCHILKVNITNYYIILLKIFGVAAILYYVLFQIKQRIDIPGFIDLIIITFIFSIAFMFVSLKICLSKITKKQIFEAIPDKLRTVYSYIM